jgi:hypothetical protein
MWVYVIIAVILFLSGLITFLAINSTQAKARSRKALTYLLFFGVLLALPGLSGMLVTVTETVWSFILLQVFYLGMGILFRYLLGIDLFGTLKSETVSQTALVVANAALGYLGFTFLFNYFNADGIGHLYGMSVLLFLIPQFFMVSFDLMTAIPPEIYKVW